MFKYARITFGLLLALPFFATAQLDKTAYCDAVKPPNKDACADIKNRLVDNNLYIGDEWWSGNCKIQLTGMATDPHSILGSDLKVAIQNILDRCDSGFEYVAQAGFSTRVNVGLCTIGQQGIEVECSGPFQHVVGSSKREIEAPAPGRRHLTDVTSANPGYVFRRQTEVPPSVVCAGGPAPAMISDCLQLGDEMVAENPTTIILPYIKNVGTCELRVYSVSKNNLDASSINVRQYINDDSNIYCKDATGTLVGFVSDYSVFDNGDDGFPYHVFFGAFCGRFGSGIGPACTSGGKV